MLAATLRTCASIKRLDMSIKSALSSLLQPIGLLITAITLATAAMCWGFSIAWQLWLLWLLLVCVLEARRTPSSAAKTAFTVVGGITLFASVNSCLPESQSQWGFALVPVLMCWMYLWQRQRHIAAAALPPLNLDTPLPLRMEQAVPYPWGSLFYSILVVLLLACALGALSQSVLHPSWMTKLSGLILATILCGLAYLTWKARAYFLRRHHYFAQYGGEWLQINEHGLAWRKFNSTAKNLLPSHADYVHVNLDWEHISNIEMRQHSNAGKYLRINSKVAFAHTGLSPHYIDIDEQEVAYPLATLHTYLQQLWQYHTHC